MKHHTSFIVALALCGAAQAAIEDISPERWVLYRGTSIVQPRIEHDTKRLCQESAPLNDVQYNCRGTVTFIKRAEAPPPVCPPAPAARTQTAACPSPLTGSWPQTSTATVGAAPTCAVTWSAFAPTTPPAGACVSPPPPPPVTSAYPHYPALNLTDIPWHTASGPWGPQVALQAPALPVTTRQVSVSTPQAFNQAAAVPGTQITITSGWAGNSLVTINASDIDVIIPQGVAIGAVEIGLWPRTTPIAKVRIRGGGRMGQFRAGPGAPGVYTDFVIDGIDLNGDSPLGGSETHQAFRVNVTRMAVLNVRAISAAIIWLGDAKHVVIANSNFYHGAATRAQAGYVEGWGIRNTGGPMTIIDSRIQGTRYHNIRAQSVGGTGELLYVGRSTLVAMAEGRTAWMWNNLGNGPWFGQGAILEGNSIYTYAAPGCGFGAEISSANVTWSRVANNRFFGGGGAVFTSVSANGGGTEGNTFAPLTALPAWGGPGDPRQVPLPNGMTVIAGEGSCPSAP